MKEIFEARQMREDAVPRLNRLQAAKRMGISHAYLYELERGTRDWTIPLRAKFLQVLQAWRNDPTPLPRKKRSDAGIKRTAHWKLRAARRKAKRAEFEAKKKLAVVPHSHRKIVGIG